jgi:hypothetical protein
MFSKNPEISIFMKIRPVGAGLFHTNVQMGGQKYERTDMLNLIVTFRHFVNDRKLLISAPSSFPAVDRCLQIRDRTARLKVMNQSLAAGMNERTNITPFKTDKEKT